LFGNVVEHQHGGRGKFKVKKLIGMILAFCLIASTLLPASAVDQLLKSDFNKVSFAKTIDFFDYVKAYALLHGMKKPSDNWRAYVYLTYVNKSGLKMFYAGLCNISNGMVDLSIPLQTLMLYYKTQNKSRDIIVSSSFVMLMAFNDTTQSKFPNSPDVNDNLWASLSLGFNLEHYFSNASFPALTSKTEIYPLKHSEDGLTWTWGMRYTNLTAIWWRTFIREDNHTYVKLPNVITTYDELTFNYTLEIKPDENKAVLRQDHTIGRIRNLWHFWGWFIVPLYNRYNSSGCYRYGKKISNETVYDFLQRHKIKMSVINFQTSVVLERKTYCKSTSGENVTDRDLMIDSTISTYCDDGEKVFDTNFGVKENYKLFNYTRDPTETEYEVYKAITRTCEIHGIAQNSELLKFHNSLLKYLPLVIAHMRPELFQKAKETITNMTKAKYLYIISYPNYSGFRIEHDPVYTAYIASPPEEGGEADKRSPLLGFMTLVAVAVTVIILVILALAVIKLLKRKPESET